ncbi:hypothetical protein [Acidovorax temperans]|uniref:hypothetical protein n=1 Tax=Acidovorax temperans TaxID=80878 RepID=UPI0035ADE69C
MTDTHPSCATTRSHSLHLAATPLRKGSAVAVAAVALMLVACKDKSPEAPPPAPAVPVETAPATFPAAAPAAAVPAPTPAAAPATVAAPKRVPLAVQGVAPAGVTVRVKAVEIGADATVLDVSISFANRITDTTMLALADTYLQDESGARLHIKRPDNNRDITIREGETLDGQLVFMGAVAPSARKLKLVFNEGNQGDNIVAPGLVVDLPLQGG